MKKNYLLLLLSTTLSFASLAQSDLTGDVENTADPNNVETNNASASNDSEVNSTNGLYGGAGSTVTQGDGTPQIIGESGIPVDTHIETNNELNVLIHMSCYAQNLRQSVSGLLPGETISGTVCFKNTTAAQDKDFLKFEFTGVSSSEILQGHHYDYRSDQDTNNPSILNYVSVFHNGDMEEDLEFHYANHWKNPSDQECRTHFKANGTRTLTHGGIQQDPTNGNTLIINVAFPGDQVGVCGSFISPLVMFFEPSKPMFTSIVEFPLHEFTKKTYWPEAKSKAYILSFDKNKNGTIDNAEEIFTNKQYDNAFEQLKAFDSNKDNVLNGKDKDFAQLKLWLDKNEDGKSQKEELSSLADLKVQSIDLKYQSPGIVNIANRAQKREVSSFEFKKDGKTEKGSIIDYWFAPYFDPQPAVKAAKN